MPYYPVTLIRVLDARTIEVDISLGFGVWLRSQYVRLSGIETPESCSPDSVEKHYGNLALAALTGWTVGKQLYLVVQETCPDRDKHGRILGDLSEGANRGSDTATKYLLRTYHAVSYYGQDRESVRETQIGNRERVYHG